MQRLSKQLHSSDFKISLKKGYRLSKHAKDNNHYFNSDYVQILNCKANSKRTILEMLPIKKYKEPIKYSFIYVHGKWVN